MHKNLFSSRTIDVALIGCGGSGSQMLTGLGRMNRALTELGIANLKVCVYDPDQVSPSNIGRQLFSAGDIGHNKAEVLVNRINAFFGTDWKAVPEAFHKGNQQDSGPIYGDKLIISCVDTKAARKQIYECSGSQKGYWLDLGNDNHTGQAILGNMKYAKMSWRERKRLALLPCVADLFPEIIDTSTPEDDSPSCSLADALEKQDLMVNQIVVTHALELLWQLLRDGEIAVHGFFFDAKAFRVQPMKVDAEAWKRYLKNARDYRKAAEMRTAQE